ncbi:MAG TPA: sigma-70 family RNA polymerase sigma factor [Bryobacteraceae bacterium]|nr:sigma-70 family RNA polymerase sigma factor [Bryobacteraceae bacterium]
MEYAGEATMRLGMSALGGERAGWSAAAFEAVFLEHYARLVAVVQRVLGDRAQAEEIASDAFLKLYRQPSAPDGYQNLGGWLYRTASRLGIDALRAGNRRRQRDPEAGERLAESGAAAGPLEDVLRRERAKNVRAALATLKPAQAQILTLRASGLSYREVAEAMGVKSTSVGQSLARAEAAFEKAYRRIGGEPNVHF